MSDVAQSHEPPRIRVRRVPDRRTLFGRQAVYEVEFALHGAQSPEWVRKTTKPSDLIEPYVSVNGVTSVILEASQSWSGGVGPWAEPPAPFTPPPGQPVKTRAADYGQPRVRVRRLPDKKASFGHREVFEVEFTPVGADKPEWAEQTTDPYKLISPYLPGTDGYSVVINARKRWTGGVGPWSALFYADEED